MSKEWSSENTYVSLDHAIVTEMERAQANEIYRRAKRQAAINFLEGFGHKSLKSLKCDINGFRVTYDPHAYDVTPSDIDHEVLRAISILVPETGKLELLEHINTESGRRTVELIPPHHSDNASREELQHRAAALEILEKTQRMIHELQKNGRAASAG